MTEVAVLPPTGPAAALERGRSLRVLARDRLALVGLIIVAVVILAAAAAPWLATHDPNATDFSGRFASPSTDHLFGTDQVGRDVFARVLHGARLSLGMAMGATAGITFLGLALGLLAGMYGRVLDGLIMRVVDVMQALPTLILALVVVGVLGQGLRNLVITIALIGWTGYARIVRSMVLKLREQEFVQVASALGASRFRVLIRHVAPNLIGPVAVLSTIDMGRVLLAVSGLSFLGFGVAPPTPEWGAMLSEAKQYLDRAPELLVYPGLAITVMVLAFNLMGDGLRDVLDPHMVQRASGWGRWRRPTLAGAPGERPAEPALPA